MQNKEVTREKCLSDLLQKFVLFKHALEACGNRVAFNGNDDFSLVLEEVGRYMTTTEEAATMFMKYLMLPSQPT